MEQYKIKDLERQARRAEKAALVRDERLDDHVTQLQRVIRETQDRVADLEELVKRMRREHAKIMRAMDVISRKQS